MFPKNPTIPPILLMLIVLKPLTASDTTLFLSNQNSYILETTSLSKNTQNLQTKLTDFIPDLSQGISFKVESPASTLSSFACLPLFSSSNQVLYSFDESQVYLVNYDLLLKSYSNLDPIALKDIFAEADLGKKMQGMLCLDTFMCYFELLDVDNGFRELVQVAFDFTNETKQMVFDRDRKYEKIKMGYQEKKPCRVQFLSDNNTFLRFCENGKTPNVFKVDATQEDPDVELLDSLKNIPIREATLSVLEHHFKVLFLQNEDLWKFEINGIGEKNLKLLLSSIKSFFEIETGKLYFIDQQNHLYFQDTRQYFRYQIKEACVSFEWFELRDTFFLCIGPGQNNTLNVSAHLAQYEKSQSFTFENASLAHVGVMQRIQHLLFFVHMTDQDEQHLLSFQVYKILLEVTLPGEGAGADCEYFMKNCRRFDVSFKNDQNYSIFKFGADEEGRFEYAFDFLYRSKKLESVNWKYLDEDNYIIIDDYITGFVRDTSVSASNRRTGQPDRISTDTFDLFLLNHIQISLPKCKFGGNTSQFVLSSNSNFVSGIVYSDNCRC